MELHKKIKPLNYNYFIKKLDPETLGIDILRSTELINIKEMYLLVLHLDEGVMMFERKKEDGIIYFNEKIINIEVENKNISLESIYKDFKENIFLDLCLFEFEGMFICLARKENQEIGITFYHCSKANIDSVISIFNKFYKIGDFKFQFDENLSLENDESTILFPKFIDFNELSDSTENLDKENLKNTKKISEDKNLNENNEKSKLKMRNIKFIGKKIVDVKDGILKMLIKKIKVLFIRENKKYCMKFKLGKFKGDILNYKIVDFSGDFEKIMNYAKEMINVCDYIEGEAKLNNVKLIMRKWPKLTIVLNITSQEIDIDDFFNSFKKILK